MDIKQSSGKSLLSGVFPSSDQYGNKLRGDRGLKANSPICGGWRGGFESWCGDWKERSLSHAFVKRNFQSTFLCDQCQAVQPFNKTPEDIMPLIYSDFRLNAPWTATVRNHQEYLNQTPLRNQSPWIQVPGFSICRVRWDSAHTILLGTGKDVAASFLCDLVTWNKSIPTLFPNMFLFLFSLQVPNQISHVWCQTMPHPPMAWSEVELPILAGLGAKGVQQLDTLESGVLLGRLDGNRDARGNFIMSQLGVSFRRWCKQHKVERPPCTFNMHLIGRGDNDSQNSYPVLDSNIKASHTKPVLFFLSELATEIAAKCGWASPETKWMDKIPSKDSWFSIMSLFVIFYANHISDFLCEETFGWTEQKNSRESKPYTFPKVKISLVLM